MSQDGRGESGRDRRTFLKRSAAAISAVSLAGCAPGGEDEAGPDSRASLDPGTLRAIADVVLPGELGDGGRESAVQSFESWLAGVEPVAELNHGYGTAEISYAPADPAPAWAAQLEALDLEARKRHASGFASLPTTRRRELLDAGLADAGPRLPAPARAGHVALALVAHYMASPAATDVCYGVAIGRRSCRGIASAPEPPVPLRSAQGDAPGGSGADGLARTAGRDAPGGAPPNGLVRTARASRPTAEDHRIGLGD